MPSINPTHPPTVHSTHSTPSRLSAEHVLIVADSTGEVERAALSALPGVTISRTDSWFSAIAFLSQLSQLAPQLARQSGHHAQRITTILASAEPIERRPESAVRTLRQLAGDARLILFGDPTLEPLSRKMMKFGCDDYIISPAIPAEVSQVLGAPRLRIAPDEASDLAAKSGAHHSTGSIDELPRPDDMESAQSAIVIADAVLAALIDAPHTAIESAVARISAQLGLDAALTFTPTGAPAPAPPQGRTIVSHAVRMTPAILATSSPSAIAQPAQPAEIGHLHLALPINSDANSARHLVSRLAGLLGQVRQIQSRQAALQRLAITDELTGLRNARSFRHMLSKILDLARERRFPVTLFIFDIDNFKQYNDRFGHGMGDEILRQTAQLMRRACREDDVVARIGGDEFAVVFWEQDAARAPHQPPTTQLKPPQTPVEVLNRFRRQLAAHDLPNLGALGKGVLTISGGIAVFPYDAADAEQLIAAADAQLMHRAKKAGKNSIYLVGNAEGLPQG